MVCVGMPGWLVVRSVLVDWLVGRSGWVWVDVGCVVLLAVGCRLTAVCWLVGSCVGSLCALLSG